MKSPGAETQPESFQRLKIGKDLAVIAPDFGGIEMTIGDLIERPTPLGQILIAKGQARKFQVEFLAELQEAYKKSHSRMKLGELLVKHRVISQEILESALIAQKEAPLESLTEIIQNYEHQVSRLTMLIPSSNMPKV